MHKPLISIAIVTALFTSGCSTVGDGLQSASGITDFVPDLLDKAPLIYRPTIEQGNVVTQQQVNQLKPGMSRRQVQFALGSPTLRDVFHENRWEYPYTIGTGSTPDEYRYLSVYFEDDQLVRIAGDLRPQPLAEQAPVEKPKVVDVPDWEPEPRTLFDYITDTLRLK